MAVMGRGNIDINSLINDIYNDYGDSPIEECSALIQAAKRRDLSQADAKVVLVRATNIAENLELGEPQGDNEARSPKLRAFKAIMIAYGDKNIEREAFVMLRRSLALAGVPGVIIN
jgi:hypothetical protein